MNRATRFVVAAAVTALVVPALATAQSAMDNAMLQSKVKTKLMTDDFMEGAGINLETSDGVVQLGGFIDDEAKGKKAAELVAGVEGVKEVDNQLHQKSGERTSGQVIDDGTITTMVKAGLADADLGTAASINVDTYNGVVLLTGFVDSKETAKLAEKYASEQANVNKVINGIYVRK
jgi:hyperosmotically inducible protein